MIYHYHMDPGHGWIQVPLAELARLGLKPSRYSYKDERFAYLEEDCDASQWMAAKRKMNERFELAAAKYSHESFIRSLDRF